MGSDEDHSSDLTSEHDLGSGSGSKPEPEPESEEGSEEFQNYELQDVVDSQDDLEEDSHEQNPPNSPEQDDGFSHSPKSQHSAVSMYEDLWGKLLEGSLRPRTSTSVAWMRQRRSFRKLMTLGPNFQCPCYLRLRLWWSHIPIQFPPS